MAPKDKQDSKHNNKGKQQGKGKGRDIAEDLEGDADKIPSRLRFDSKGNRIKD